MKIYRALLATTAIVSVIAPVASVDAAAAGHLHHHPHHPGQVAHPAGDDGKLREMVAQLQAEVASLHQEVVAQRQSQTATQAELAQTSVQVGAIHTEIAAAPAAVTPGQVQSQIASAIDTEHHQDHFDFKGLRITPGGFLEMAGVYRQHYQGNDIASSYAIPFGNSRAAAVSEGRFSARQSRLSFLAQGKPSKDVTLSMYGEFDFLGGAQTANSNESNSYNPRIRNLYASVDWDKGNHGWHFLAGQNWSLVTMNTKGISPRNELTPPQIDAQYIPGFVWARQPQLRITGDFLDHHLWVAISAENPATTVAGTVPTIVTNTIAAGSGFDSANTLSLNHTPDFVGKLAYEGAIAGHNLHVEGFVLDRTFSAHFNGNGNENKRGYGFGGGVVLQLVPKVLDVQFSGMAGQGIGRYGSAQLPDVTFDANGTIHPVKEFMLLGGATLHATRMLDLYTFAGEEQESSARFGTYGIGLVTANNTGCFTEGGTCAGNTRRIRQLTAGFWEKIYNGSFGRAQVGVQYSYTQRELFDGVGGEPQVGQNMGLFSFRYYPF